MISCSVSSIVSGILICFFNILAWYVLPVSILVRCLDLQAGLNSVLLLRKLGALEHTINLAALISPVLGSRLILNLRDAYYRPFADEIELRFL